MAIWTAKDMPRQDGKRVLVTGGPSGIGFQVARRMAEKGARVMIAGRDAAKGEQALKELRRMVPNGDFSFGAVDLASLASIEIFARDLLNDGEPLDMLFNVAGVMLIPQRQLTADGFEMHMGTNFLGPFALSGRLLPLLSQSKGRVITVSARAAQWYKLDTDDLQSERSYRPMRAYGLSKLADVLFALELNRRAAGAGIASLAVDPGTANTALQRHAPGAMQVLSQGLINVIGYPLDRVADTIAYAATVPDIRPDTYIGPTTMIQSCGSPGPIALPKQAADATLRETLWQRAEALTGVSYRLH